MASTREQLLTDWATYLVEAAHSGALMGKPCPIARIETVAGPRAGALEIYAGIQAGALLRALGRNNCATTRQFVPWQFTGEPQVFMSGRYVRLEAGWPSDLAEHLIRLGDLGEHPRNSGRWIAGKSETGTTVVAGLSDRTPHYLLAGQTGSGKTVALRSAVLQLSADPTNEIVLVDGKAGEGLSTLTHLPGIIGPVACENPEIRSALGWACMTMRQRYQSKKWQGRVVVVVDEFQELVQDPVVVNLLRKLVAQGRACQVHCLLATQHPTVSAFGDSSIRRNLPGKLALMVGDPDASRVAVGGATPRADHLLGAGDAYAVGPGACHRLQVAYVDDREIQAGGQGQYRFTDWPEYKPEQVGQDLPVSQFVYSGAEIGVAVISASHGEGRTRFTARMKGAGFGTPGYNRQKRLRDLGQGALDWMRSQQYDICDQHTYLPANALSHSENSAGPPQDVERECLCIGG